uniref:RRM domain-containing protein n=2 Tax=Aegilops tauschii subsp. strangulata TaxID=200361 RepID=A0A453LBV1_AEGTS
MSYYLVFCTDFDRNGQKQATSIVEDHCHPVKWELDMQRYCYFPLLVLVVVLSSLICGLLTIISCSVCQGSAGVRMREAKIPTNVLRVGLPNTHKVNEEALRRAMAAHGVVTDIRVFPERRYAFVEFATIEGASNAKNLLDGCLFNNTRIHVLFSGSGLDNLTPLVGFPRSEIYSDSPHAACDYFGAGHSSHGTSQGYDPRRGRSR